MIAPPMQRQGSRMGDLAHSTIRLLALAEKLEGPQCLVSADDRAIAAAACRIADKSADEGVRITAEMVRAAFNEGFIQGTAEHTSSKGGYSWHDSKAKAALSPTEAPKP